MTNKLLVLMLSSVGFLLVSTLDLCAQRTSNAIVSPVSGTIFSQEERQNFEVQTSIEQFSSDRHYWLVIASALTDEIYFRQNVNALRGTLKDWKPDLVWPKHYIKQNPDAKRVFDGGTNPDAALQPMLLLVLEVDGSASMQFSTWLRTAAPDFAGIPFKDLEDKVKVVGRAEIFFE